MEIKNPSTSLVPTAEILQYRAEVKKRLEELRPIFAAAAIGNFSLDIELPEHDDEFTETFVGVQIMVEVVRAQLNDLQTLNATLQKSVAELQAAMEKQLQADKEMNQFIAVLAHELRNPLAPIVSTLEWLENQAERPESVKMIQNAEYQASMMKKLLDDLLDIARVSQDKFKLNKEHTDLVAVIDHAIHGASLFIKLRGHALISHLPRECICIYGDGFRLTQALSNILFNAAKYTNPGGLIEVFCETTGENAIIKIKDNGVGIPKEMLGRVFDAFTQVKPAPQVGSGLGIGLALTKRLIEMHGGTIEAQSEGKDTGTVFTINVPILKVAVKPENPKGRPIKTTRPLKILLVDDNEAAAQSLGMILQYHGHEVDLAYSGNAAISKIETFRPNVVLLDIGLPDKNGYEVIALMKQKPHSALFVALTGFGQEEDKRKSREAGFHHHLIKPIGYADLEKILNEVKTL